MDKFECNVPQHIGNLKEVAQNVDVDNADLFFETPNQSMRSIFDDTLTSTPKEDIFYTPRRETPFRKPVNVCNESSSGESSHSSDVVNNNDHHELDITLTEKPTPIDSNLDSSITPNLDEFFKEPEKDELTTPEVTGEDLAKPGPSRQDTLTKSTKTITFKEAYKTPEKIHTMVSRLDLRKNTPRYNNSDDNKKVLKRKIVSPNAMTMAEQILHFQKDTPPRFKSRTKQEKPLNTEIKRLRLTIAQSPILATKLRACRNLPSTAAAKPQDKTEKDILRPSILNQSVMSTASQSSRRAKTRPEAHSGVKATTAVNRKITMIPFSFDARDKAKQEEKENRKLKLKQDVPVFKFTAQPVPTYLRRKAKGTQTKS